MSQKKKRKKKKATQESTAAHGTLVDVRRNMARAGGKGDNSLKVILWITLALVAGSLAYAVLAP